MNTEGHRRLENTEGKETDKESTQSTCRRDGIHSQEELRMQKKNENPRHENLHKTERYS